MRYYVYAWFDPRTGIIRYVGKGCGRRASSSHDGNWQIVKLEEELRSLDLSFISILVRVELSEDEAFSIETSWITAIGRKDLGTGPLLNLTNGGPGIKFAGDETLDRMRAAAYEKASRPEFLVKMQELGLTMWSNPDYRKKQRQARDGWTDLDPEEVAEKLRRRIRRRARRNARSAESKQLRKTRKKELL